MARTRRAGQKAQSVASIPDAGRRPARALRSYRQGDLLFVALPSQSRSADIKIIENGVLARGEATGHAHRLVLSPQARAFVDSLNRILVEVEQGGVATIVHEEHKALTLPAGTYQVVRQREWCADQPHDVQD